MEENKKFDSLNKQAIEYFKQHNVDHTAVAISGSEESLVLLNAAVQALGNENVLAIVADTGYIPEKVIDIIESACDLVNVDRCILPVYITKQTDSTVSSADYKQQIFEEMLQECWILGFDLLSYACTDSNFALNGNEVIATFDGVAAPFCRLH